MDYEVEYNNRARVPENPAIIAGWSRDATAYREAHQARLKVIPYGTGERNRIDLFSGDGAGAIVVFIHGGYWQALDGSFFSHLAAGLNAHGIDVAVPSYDLCPAVSVAEIIGEMRAASRELAKLGRPLVVSGHSAGGHLAACMLATDWRAFDPSLPDELVTAAYAISGLFDLRPLVSTSINTALKLDDASARAVSPCSGSRRRTARWMRWSEAMRAPNISGRAAPLSMPGARLASRRDLRQSPTPTILPPSRRSPTPIRR